MPAEKGPQEICPGCRGNFSQLPMPRQITSYTGASPRCWQAYNALINKQFQNEQYFPAHRMTIDAYAAQHPGDQSDPKARQSANLHLISLYLYFEKDFSEKQVISIFQDLIPLRENWPEIKALENPKWLTVLDLLHSKEGDAKKHLALVKKWAKSVWEAYASQHETIIETFQLMRSLKITSKK